MKSKLYFVLLGLSAGVLLFAFFPSPAAAQVTTVITGFRINGSSGPVNLTIGTPATITGQLVELPSFAGVPNKQLFFRSSTGFVAPFVSIVTDGGGNVNVQWTPNSLTDSGSYWLEFPGDGSYASSISSNISVTIGGAGTPPTVTTGAATLITSTSATLNATINANGLSTTAWFRYGSSVNCVFDTGGTRIPATGGLPAGSGTTNFTVGQAITGLTPGTAYVFCARATNSGGGTGGTGNVFDTPAGGGAFDFSLANGGNKSVARGASVTNGVTATLVSGTASPVSFSASGLPSGVTASFLLPSCNPTCTTTLTLVASISAATGSAPITVTATGGGVTRTTSFTLAVTTGGGAFTIGLVSPASAQEGVATTFTAPVAMGGAFNVVSCTLNVDANPPIGMVNQATGSSFTVSPCISPNTCTASASYTFPAGSAGPHNAFVLCADNASPPNAVIGATTPITATAGGGGGGGACAPPNTCVATCTGSPAAGTCPIVGNVCCPPAGGGGAPPVTIKFENPLGEGTTFSSLMNSIINFLFTIAVILAPILLVVAGVIFMTAAGDPGKVKTARSMMLWTLVGFAIILISKGLVTVLKTILTIKP